MNAGVPEIETERLILRAWRADDLDAFASFMADEETVKYVTGQPLSRTDAWRSLATMIGHWQLRGYGNWAIERKEDGAFIGRAGPWFPDGWPRLELGWLLGKPYWGRGYATEAAQAALNFMFETLALDEVVSLIDAANTPSQAVAERLGETRGQTTSFVIGPRTVSVQVWRLSRDEWRSDGAIRPL